MFNDSIKNALMARRGKSIQVIVDGEVVVDTDEGKAPVEAEVEVEAEAPEAEGDPEKEMGEALVGGMSDYDKQSMATRKPKSLTERVQQEALKRGK